MRESRPRGKAPYASEQWLDSTPAHEIRYGLLMTIRFVFVPITLFISLFLTVTSLLAKEADLILHRGKIVTVDAKFSIAQAVAVKSGRILKVGSDREILMLKRPQTRTVDLGGKTVLPGLMDSHAHPADA